MANALVARRVVSAASTVVVNQLPLWLPAAGSWGQVSSNIAADVKGNYAYFTSSRSLDALFNNYSGAVWNPYLGTYGSYLFHGGGHATTAAMLDNAVYRWDAYTRSWSQMSVPTYPGELGAPDWVIGREPPYDSALLNTYGEVATGVPASNHSRWLPCVIPPANGGGTEGSLMLPYLASIHTGGNGGSGWSHRFDCGSAAWSRFGSNACLGAKGWAACVDTDARSGASQGYVYISHGPPSGYQLERQNIATGARALVTPSGFTNNDIAGVSIQYAPEHGMLIILASDFTLRLIDAAAGTLTMVTPSAPSGTPPSGGAPVLGDGGGFVWCPDLGANGAVVHWNYNNNVVKACYAPASPLGGAAWTWATLSASNSPSMNISGRQGHWYNAFQYAPALKSFFIASMAEGSLNAGGMWCFRPSEIV